LLERSIRQEKSSRSKLFDQPNAFFFRPQEEKEKSAKYLIPDLPEDKSLQILQGSF
jgi:hypothetical protein